MVPLEDHNMSKWRYSIFLDFPSKWIFYWHGLLTLPCPGYYYTRGVNTFLWIVNLAILNFKLWICEFGQFNGEFVNLKQCVKCEFRRFTLWIWELDISIWWAGNLGILICELWIWSVSIVNLWIWVYVWIVNLTILTCEFVNWTALFTPCLYSSCLIRALNKYKRLPTLWDGSLVNILAFS